MNMRWFNRDRVLIVVRNLPAVFQHEPATVQWRCGRAYARVYDRIGELLPGGKLDGCPGYWIEWKPASDRMAEFYRGQPEYKTHASLVPVNSYVADRIDALAAMRSVCECGSSELCESCSPFSAFNVLRQELHAMASELRGQPVEVRNVGSYGWTFTTKEP